MPALAQVGRAPTRTLLPDAHIAQELNALSDGKCPVCNFPARVKGGQRIHDEAAQLAVLRFGCNDLTVTRRRRLDLEAVMPSKAAPPYAVSPTTGPPSQV